MFCQHPIPTPGVKSQRFSDSSLVGYHSPQYVARRSVDRQVNKGFNLVAQLVSATIACQVARTQRMHPFGQGPTCAVELNRYNVEYSLITCTPGQLYSGCYYLALYPGLAVFQPRLTENFASRFVYSGWTAEALYSTL
jgi:hypothetical protein